MKRIYRECERVAVSSKKILYTRLTTGLEGPPWQSFGVECLTSPILKNGSYMGNPQITLEQHYATGAGEILSLHEGLTSWTELK